MCILYIIAFCDRNLYFSKQRMKGTTIEISIKLREKRISKAILRTLIYDIPIRIASMEKRYFKTVYEDDQN
jgi:hypothetical protein